VEHTVPDNNAVPDNIVDELEEMLKRISSETQDQYFYEMLTTTDLTEEILLGHHLDLKGDLEVAYSALRSNVVLADDDDTGCMKVRFSDQRSGNHIVT
jgi:hypothetical protein